MESQNEFFIDQTLYSGAPDRLFERSETERLVYQTLERLHIPFTRVDHAPAATIADCKNVDRLLGTKMCKNLFLTNAQKTAFYLLLMPGEKPFRTKDLSKQIGSARLSFADAEYMWEFLHIRPGAVSVMGLLFDTERRVRLLIDRELLSAPCLGCHPCENTSSLGIATADILNVFLPYTGHSYTEITL